MRIGSSVRGAIDSPLVAALAWRRCAHSSATAFDVGLDACDRRAVRTASIARGLSRNAEEIVTELWHEVFARTTRGGRRGKVNAPAGPPRLNPPSAKEGAEADAAIAVASSHDSRRELARNPRFEQISPEVGELDEAAVEEGLLDDPDETLALLADLAGATDQRLARTRPPAGGAAVPRRRPARPVDATGHRQARRAAVSTGWRRPRPRRQLRRDRRGRRREWPSMPERLRITVVEQPDTALCLLVDRSGSMGGKPLATARDRGRRGRAAQPERLQRARVRQGRRRGEGPATPTSRASVWSTTCCRCAAMARPTWPERCAPPAISWRRSTRRAQDHDPAQRLPRDRRRRRRRCRSRVARSW